MPCKTAIFTATGFRGGKTMKNCAGNRSEGALRAKTRDFPTLFSIFWPYRPKTRRKTKILNNGLLGTTHKLSLGNALRSLQSYRVQPVGRPQNPDVGLRNNGLPRVQWTSPTVMESASTTRERFLRAKPGTANENGIQQGVRGYRRHSAPQPQR